MQILENPGDQNIDLFNFNRNRSKMADYENLSKA